nr:aminoglycoside phosphotransferase family protein [uncultured Friedmanniella sp.]
MLSGVAIDGGGLSTTVAAELALRVGVPRSLPVGEQWVGATSTVVRWGDELTVKIPHGDEEAVRACLVHAEVSSAARLLGVHAPEVIAVVDLSPMATVPLIVSRYVRGRRLSPGDPTPSVWAAVGSQLSALHTATAAVVPPGLRTFTQTDGVDPGVMAERLRSAGRLSRGTVAQLMRLRDQLVGYAVPDEHQVLCHGDVHAENVIASAGRYVGLIDFAGAGWLDAAWDFVGVPLAAVAPMLDGYGAVDQRRDSMLSRVTWCRLQTAVHRLATSASPEADAARAVTQADLLLA